MATKKTKPPTRPTNRPEGGLLAQVGPGNSPALAVTPPAPVPVAKTWDQMTDAEKEASIAAAFGGADNAVAFAQAANPTNFPEGSYDPQLDAQGFNQNQGSLWATEDYDQGNLRRDDDYATAQAALGLSHGRTLADLQTASDRDLADFNTRTADLGTQYERLGTNQTQAANAAGVGGGGALVAAATARAGNQATDQSKLQSGFDRQNQDIATSRDRENQNYDTGLSGLQLNYTRGTQDAKTGQERQLISNSEYQQQLENQKNYQVQNSGTGLYLPDIPSAPTTATINGTVHKKTSTGTYTPVRKVPKNHEPIAPHGGMF